MKTPKATKTPSGKWRIQIQIDGKRMSITADTKTEAQNKAKQLYAGFKAEKRSPFTVGKAIDKYIEAKENVLSPSTVRSYQAMRKNRFQSLMGINLSDLTALDIQKAIGEEQVAGLSPKTIKNAYGLLSAMLKEFKPSFVVNPKLPQRVKSDIRIPTEEEMVKIWHEAKGTDYELPILLAAWLGLRLSEIKGLMYSDIQGDYVHIQRAMVRGPRGQVLKGTKTVSGDRWIKLPSDILSLVDCYVPKEHWHDREEFIIQLSASKIYENFIKICARAEVEPCRFHDLRHFAASEAHALGVPNKYAMRRMGHATDNMLKTVYQHTMDDKQIEFDNMIDNKMSELFEKSRA